ncbi:efflux RND transporter periplasmic adaptor subunit [Candidatus Latescibacterota bacterium]
MRHLLMFVLKSFKNKRIRIISGAVSIIVLVIIFFNIGGSFEENEKWQAARKGDFVIELIENGEIKAVNADYVRAPNEWQMELQIIKLAPEGKIVEAGEFLLQFDTGVLDEEMGKIEDNLKQAEADLHSIDSQQENRLFEMETALEIAKYSLEAAKLQTELIKFESKNKQEESRIDFKKAEIRYDEAEKKIETQKIIDKTERMKVAVKLDQAKLNLEQIKRRIDNLTLRAPIAGMVVYNEIGGYGPSTARYKASVGDKVNSGQSVISIPDLSKIKMVVKLNEMDAGKLSVGKKAFIRLDAFEEVEYHGAISDISSVVNKGNERYTPVAKAPSVEISILIEEKDVMLKPGMTAQARIILEEIPDVISIPVGTVFEDENGSTVIYTRKSYPDPVPVKLGKRNNNYVIVENNLPEGTEISWTPPPESSHPLGRFAEMERRRTEFQEYVDHIGKMDELGLTDDSDLPDSLRVKTGPDDGSNSGDVRVGSSGGPAIRMIMK